jgi:hypothetical protein
MFRGFRTPELIQAHEVIEWDFKMLNTTYSCFSSSLLNPPLLTFLEVCSRGREGCYRVLLIQKPSRNKRKFSKRRPSLPAPLTVIVSPFWDVKLFLLFSLSVEWQGRGGKGLHLLERKRETVLHYKERLKLCRRVTWTRFPRLPNHIAIMDKFSILHTV